MWTSGRPIKFERLTPQTSGGPYPFHSYHCCMIVLPLLLTQDSKAIDERYLTVAIPTASFTECVAWIQTSKVIHKHTLLSHNMQPYQLVARLQEVCPTSEGSCRAEQYKPGRWGSQYGDTRWSASHCLAVLHWESWGESVIISEQTLPTENLLYVYICLKCTYL